MGINIKIYAYLLCIKQKKGFGFVYSITIL